MSTPTTIELTNLLSPETLERLQAEAERQHIPLPDLVRAAIEDYLDIDDEEDYEDTPIEEIEAGFLQGWHEAMTGQTIPGREALAALFEVEATHESPYIQNRTK
jgi:predicted transcriptional regulator